MCSCPSSVTVVWSAHAPDPYGSEGLPCTSGPVSDAQPGHCWLWVHSLAGRDRELHTCVPAHPAVPVSHGALAHPVLADGAVSECCCPREMTFCVTTDAASVHTCLQAARRAQLRQEHLAPRPSAGPCVVSASAAGLSRVTGRQARTLRPRRGGVPSLSLSVSPCP